MHYEIIQGDITRINADIIVNAANNGLRGGGGVDGAIHRAAGGVLLQECRKIGYCATGAAVITAAGNLPARYVVHTVGPVWRGGTQGEAALLAGCYRESLALAETYRAASIAFPNISTGVYGYPKILAAQCALTAVTEYFRQPSQIRRVFFVCFDAENADIYRRLLPDFQAA